MPITPFRAHVSSSASDVQLVPSRAGRKRLHIHNASIYGLRVCEGAAASLTDYTMYIPPGSYWEAESPIYTGEIRGIWSSADGYAQIAEGV